MDATIQNVILGRLCSALSDIVIDILKYCNLDVTSQDMISTNISNIRCVLQNSSVAATEKEHSDVSVNSPSNPRTTRLANRQTNKRKATDTSKVESTQSKKGKTDSTSTIFVETNVSNVSATIDQLNIASNSLDAARDIQTTIENDLEVELLAIIPEKKVFLSNLPSHATVKALQNHIQRKIQNFDLTSVEINKMDIGKERKHSSFVLNVKTNMDLYQTFVDANFWPAHSIVHEFNANRRKPNFRQYRKTQKRT